MQNQSMFLTGEETLIVDFLKEAPKPYSEIVQKLKKETKIKDRRTINKLLNELEAKRWIFRVEIEEEPFYRVNVFPSGINNFFAVIDQIPEKQRKDWQVLFEIKDEVLKRYPQVSFEQILERCIAHLRLTKGQKGIIETLKRFEKGEYG